MRLDWQREADDLWSCADAEVFLAQDGWNWQHRDSGGVRGPYTTRQGAQRAFERWAARVEDGR